MIIEVKRVDRSIVIKTEDNESGCSTTDVYTHEEARRLIKAIEDAIQTGITTRIEMCE